MPGTWGRAGGCAQTSQTCSAAATNTRSVNRAAFRAMAAVWVSVGLLPPAAAPAWSHPPQTRVQWQAQNGLLPIDWRDRRGQSRGSSVKALSHTDRSVRRSRMTWVSRPAAAGCRGIQRLCPQLGDSPCHCPDGGQTRQASTRPPPQHGPGRAPDMARTGLLVATEGVQQVPLPAGVDPRRWQHLAAPGGLHVDGAVL